MTFGRQSYHGALGHVWQVLRRQEPFRKLQLKFYVAEVFNLVGTGTNWERGCEQPNFDSTSNHKCFKTVFLKLKKVDIETVADQCEEKSTEQGTDEDEDELVVDSPEVVDSEHGSEGVNVEDDISQLRNVDMIKSVRSCLHI